jgi:hypothetical protein
MEEIGRKKMSNLTLDYTPGRDSCAFYIAEVIPGSGSDYNTLNLHVSTDCCQTFTTYSYLLSPDVGLKDNEVDKGGLSVSPNPASQWVSIGYTLKHSGKAAIAIFTSDGIKADGFETNYQSAGSRTLTYDCTKLKPGFYTIVLTSTDGLMKSGKMVISR